MEVPHGPEISIYELVPGEMYDAYTTRDTLPNATRFRGRLVGYYRNSANYLMIRFYPAIQEYYGEMLPIPATNPLGLYFRVWEDLPQSYRYYRTARFSIKEKKEIHERAILHERRQYERGLTGSTPDNLWFPRGLVREITLKYLTDYSVNRPKRRLLNTYSIVSRA
jgi:hypothetical protein